MGFSRGILTQQTKDVFIIGNFITQCSGVYIEASSAVRAYIVNNTMAARDGEATGDGPAGLSYGFFGASSTGVYRNNILRPSTTNALRCDLNHCTFYTEPFSKPIPGAVDANPGFTNFDFKDGQNEIGLGLDSVFQNYPVFSRTQTWNDAATVFQAYVLNAVKTAAAAGSAILHVNLADTPIFSVLPEGTRLGVTGVPIVRLRHGTAVLIGGSKVVAETSISASTRIYLTSQVDGGSPGWLRVSTRSVGVSFTITSSDAGDTSTVGWLAIEP